MNAFSMHQPVVKVLPYSRTERTYFVIVTKEYCRSFTGPNIALEKELKATFEIGYKTNMKSFFLAQISRGIERINTPVS